MRLRALLLLSTILVSANPTPGQESQGPGRVQARVTSQGADGTVVIDRGERDLVVKGDRVLLFTRGGARLSATVVQTEARSAVVELRDRGLVIEPGTRAEILIPATRRPAAAPPTPVETPVPTPENEPGAATPRWTNQDPDYKPGQPLLTGARAVRPEERAMRITGRAYAMGNVGHVPGQSFKNSFIRAGSEMLFENPFELGGGLRYQGEINYANETSGNTGMDLLLQRLSYYHGGTRFDDKRWEVGRFLQYGMPEFGLLDGAEFSQRSKSGHLLGASFGYLPTLDDDLKTGQDLQFAAFYNWVADDSERFLIGGGYQKTLHHSHNDRDLVVLKSHYLPVKEGWDFDAVVWIDFYYGTDDIKNHSVEVTQALASTSRRWENGDGLEFIYQHIQYPEMLRDEFLLPVANDIRDDNLERLAAKGWRQWTKDKRLHGYLSGFIDDDGSGTAFEAGVDVEDLYVSNSLTDFTLFGSVAQFQKVAGARTSMSVNLEDGRWDFFYEFSYNNLDKQPANSDDLLQHRLRVSRSYHTDSGWDFSAQAEVDFWDDEVSWYGGCQVQRTF